MPEGYVTTIHGSKSKGVMPLCGKDVAETARDISTVIAPFTQQEGLKRNLLLNDQF